LKCYDNQLSGLNINKCVKLERVNCDNNLLTTLDLTNLVNLKELSVADNHLENLYFSLANYKSLTNLKVSSNNFSDLSLFSKLTNLETLSIGNSNEKQIKQGVYNRCCGSLNLTKLKEIKIISHL
jgi:Leucine-rich repeat (LRR) protein